MLPAGGKAATHPGKAKEVFGRCLTSSPPPLPPQDCGDNFSHHIVMP